MSTLKHLLDDVPRPPEPKPYEALLELNIILERIDLFATQNNGLFQNRTRFFQQIGILRTNIELLKKRILKNQKLKSEAAGKKIPRAV